MTDDRGRARRSRWALLGVGATVIVVGLAARTLPGAVGDLSGGVLYAVLVFVLVAVVAPAASALRISMVSLAICVIVELLQLTALPAVLAGVFPPARLVLGTTFVATDLVSAAFGVGLALVVDRQVVRPVKEPGQPAQ